MSNRLANISVDEYTTPSPLSVQMDSSLDHVYALMEDNGIRHIPVMEEKVIVGIISDRDLNLWKRANHLFSESVAKDVMTKDPYMVLPHTSLDEVAFEMSKNKIGSAVVRYSTEEFGIFTSTDALNALIEIVRSE